MKRDCNRMLATICAIGGLGLTVAAAQASYFVDDFANGILTDSDSVTNYWSFYGGNTNYLSESSSNITLSVPTSELTKQQREAGGQIVSGMDFFSSGLRMTITGMNVSGAGADLRIGFVSSQTSTYRSDDAIELAVKYDAAKTRYLYQFGYKEDVAGNASVPANLVAVTSTASHPVTDAVIEMTATTWKLSVTYLDGNNNPQTDNFSGSHSLNAANWGTNGDSGIGLFMYANRTTANLTTASIDKIEVEALPEPATAGILLVGAGWLATRRRR